MKNVIWSELLLAFNQRFRPMLMAETDPSQMSITSGSPPRDPGLGSLCWLLSVAIVTAVLCLPFLRAIYLLMDEGMLLHGAVRLLDGKRLYALLFRISATWRIRPDRSLVENCRRFCRIRPVTGHRHYCRDRVLH